MGTGGTRFARFPGQGEPAGIFDKLDDCGVIHQLTGATPRVSLHIPWDDADPADLNAKARDLGLGFDAMNSNTFQDQPGQDHSYKYGSLSHTDAATRQHYDVIFMDGQMPVVDGFAATSLIRAAEREAGRTPVPIVAFTASALDTDRERFREAGMDDFLSKPITRQSLGEKLFKFVDDRRKSSAEPDSPLPAGNNTLSWSREA